MSKRPIIWNSGSTQHYFLGHWVNWLITLYCHSRSFYGNNTLTPWFLFILDSDTPTDEETVHNRSISQWQFPTNQSCTLSKRVSLPSVAFCLTNQHLLKGTLIQMRMPKWVLPSSQIISCFIFSRYINLDMHLDIYYIQCITKNYIYLKS